VTRSLRLRASNNGGIVPFLAAIDGEFGRRFDDRELALGDGRFKGLVPTTRPESRGGANVQRRRVLWHSGQDFPFET
jgi:hypothetical protein